MPQCPFEQRSKMKNLENFSRDELIKLIEVFAKNWLAHDGCWFLAVEEKYGMEAAIQLDTESWRRFAVAEAKRIKSAFDIPDGGGLEALEKALGYRLYSAINRQAVEWVKKNKMIFKMFLKTQLLQAMLF